MAKANVTRYQPVAMIERFIAFDTTSRNSNLPLIHFVQDYLSQFGIESDVITNENGQKANLLARIGPADKPGIVLSGHTDTVPVEDQNWSTDPFKLIKNGSRLYGRGTSDMKSFLAICTALAPEFAEAKLAAPIYLAMSYDEELGCLGVPSMISKLAELPVKPAACIVGEPSEMQVLMAHKGVNVFETTITGREAHSSQTDQGASAIAAAAELISFLNRVADEMRERGDPTKVFERDGYTSINIGLIQGGTALNIIPRTCKFVWEYRHLPGTDGKEIITRFRKFSDTEILPKLKAKADDAAIETTTVIHYEGLRPEPGSFAEALALKCSGMARPTTAAFGTEAGLFQDVGIPTVVCGPGSIAQAHRPDEFIEKTQVEQCTQFLRRLIQELAPA